MKALLVPAFFTALCLPASAAGPGDAMQFLSGTWSCGDASESYAALAPDSPWIRGTYAKSEDHPEGTIVIGYVAALDGFVYRDFHFDGGYEELFAKPPVDGRWVWTGSAYQGKGGSGALKVRITWKTIGPALFDRTFERLDGETYVKMAGDSCAKRT